MNICICSRSSFVCNFIQTDIGSAMEYLHSLTPAIVHRDLKSLNILKSYDGYYKVCDFGLVKNKNTQAGTPG